MGEVTGQAVCVHLHLGTAAGCSVFAARVLAPMLSAWLYLCAIEGLLLCLKDRKKEREMMRHGWLFSVSNTRMQRCAMSCE